MSACIILVRHGQTEWNTVDRFRGRADIDLNDTGVKQAEATAARLGELAVTAVYTSPLKRAIRTAEAISTASHVQCVPLPELIDADYGLWQGLTLKEAEERDPEVFRLWYSNPEMVRFPGGESMEEIRQRASKTLDMLLAKHDTGYTVVVSHVAVCRLLTLHFLGLETSHFWNVTQDNCGISMFEVRGGMTVATALNDTCHLKRLVA